jgi:hypothetical protein
MSIDLHTYFCLLRDAAPKRQVSDESLSQSVDSVLTADTVVIQNRSEDRVFMIKADFPISDGSIRHQLLIKSCKNTLISAYVVCASIQIAEVYHVHIV